MNDHLHKVFQDKLAELRLSYLSQLRAHVDDLIQLARSLEAHRDLTSLPAIHRLAHSLSGSAPTFGFHETGRAATELERLIAPHVLGAVPSAVTAKDVVEGVERIRAAAGQVLEGQSGELGSAVHTKSRGQVG